MKFLSRVWYATQLRGPIEREGGQWKSKEERKMGGEGKRKRACIGENLSADAILHFYNVKDKTNMCAIYTAHA